MNWCVKTLLAIAEWLALCGCKIHHLLTPGVTTESMTVNALFVQTRGRERGCVCVCERERDRKWVCLVIRSVLSKNDFEAQWLWWLIFSSNFLSWMNSLSLSLSHSFIHSSFSKPSKCELKNYFNTSQEDVQVEKMNYPLSVLEGQVKMNSYFSSRTKFYLLSLESLLSSISTFNSLKHLVIGNLFSLATFKIVFT